MFPFVAAFTRICADFRHDVEQIHAELVSARPPSLVLSCLNIICELNACAVKSCHIFILLYDKSMWTMGMSVG